MNKESNLLGRSHNEDNRSSPRRIIVPEGRSTRSAETSGLRLGNAAGQEKGVSKRIGGSYQQNRPADRILIRQSRTITDITNYDVKPTSNRRSIITRMHMIVAIGVLIVAAAGLALLLSSSKGTCPGTVRIFGPEKITSISAPIDFHLGVENTRCISRVSYQIDNIELASNDIPPYEVTLTPETLSELPDREKHELTVKFENDDGTTIARPEKLTLTVSPDAIPPQSKPGVSPTPAPQQGNVTNDTRAFCEQLAIQISHKSGYVFAPEFIEMVNARLNDYKDAEAIQLSHRYRREINKAFSDKGVDPLIGYVLAMSRSNFDADLTRQGLGLWQVPPEIARSHGYLGHNESDSALKAPGRSAEIAADYTRSLLRTFETEDFMYAIACFGMSLKEVGQVQTQLINAAPNAAERRDIIKMLKAGAINEEQVDHVARFFAAGIVGENPQAFALNNVEPFSTLY